MAEYGRGPSREEWGRHGEIINTGFKGWNVFQRLPIVMKAEIPWMREFALGFSGEVDGVSDADEWLSKGWKPCRIEHFGEGGLENFNKTVGFRFNLQAVDGVIRYKRHILMLKPIDMRKDQERKQNEEFEEYYSQLMKQTYTHPRDPRHDEMAQYAASGMTEETYVRDPGSEVTKQKISRRSSSNSIEE